MKTVVKERILGEVIDAMLVEVPKTEDELRRRLIAVRQDSCYAAPEVMVAHWRRTQDVLIACIGMPDPDSWQIRVAKVFSGQ